jgi:hypothetical protein
MPLAALGSTTPPETPEQRSHRIEYINRRWKQLYDLEKERADQAIKYLFLTNSGGAVTVLSFMGASEKARTSLGPIFALSCFVVGIILIGIFNIIQYYHMAKLFALWKQDSEKYFENPAEWTNIIQGDNKRSKTSIWAHIVAHGSFITFIAGCICGTINLLK